MARVGLAPRLILDWWPDPDDWERAAKARDKAWLRENLAKAAYTLVERDQPLTREALAPLLFRHPIHELEWRNRAARLPEGVEPAGEFRRGVSLDTLRRMCRDDEIEQAFQTARRGVEESRYAPRASHGTRTTLSGHKLELGVVDNEAEDNGEDYECAARAVEPLMASGAACSNE